MRQIGSYLLIILNLVHFIYGGCPRATFQFRNKTTLSTYNFIDSSIGNIGSLETCPYTGRPYVYLPCYPNSSWGHEPYFSNCFKPIDQTKKILLSEHPYQNLSIEQVTKLPMTTSADVTNILSYLNDDTIDYKSSLDIVSVINLIDRITQTNHNFESIYSIVDRILSFYSKFDMNSNVNSNGSIVRLLTLLERLSQNFILNDSEKYIHKTNLLISIVNQPNNRSNPVLGFSFNSVKNEIKTLHSSEPPASSTYILLDRQTIAKQNRLVFSVFDQRPGIFDSKHHRLLTQLISLTVDRPESIKTVKIHFPLENQFQETNQTVHCAFWNLTTNQWSTDGCYSDELTNSSVTCVCNHLTHFAVLMDIEQKSTPKFIEQILSIITLTGLILSTVGLCLTILTFLLFKKLRRHFSQKSLLFLSLNLLFVNILFALICFLTLNQLKPIICIVLASLLHYFILSSFSWMFIMAIIQYILFVRIFPSRITAFTRKSFAFAQIVPLIPVITVLSIDPFNYTKRTDRICWLTDLPFYLSFVLPIVLYLFVNSLIFTFVGYSLLCGKTSKQMRRNRTVESQRLSRFSMALSCFVVLGLTWIFGLFAIGSIRSIFQILFCIFASLTGFFIFILYILTSKTKRTYWNNAFKSFGISSIYSPTVSTSSGFVGSKDYSTTSISDNPKSSARLSQPQHFIDAYMPTSPPPPAPPITQTLQPQLLIENDDQNSPTNQLFEPRHVWAPSTNYIYETNQPTTSLDDYSLFYSTNHDATKL